MPEQSLQTHHFEITSTWTHNSADARQGTGTLKTSAGETGIAIPAELHGPGGLRTNPEELLLSALAACFSITFSIIAQKRRLPLFELQITTRGELIRHQNGSLQFTRASLHPLITIAAAPDDTLRSTATDTAHLTEKHCLISNAIRGNVEVTVSPAVQFMPPGQ